jgi:hypothetical protein
MANKLDILLTVLNKSDTGQKDKPLYQVIKDLINILKELSNTINSSSSGGGSSTTIINEIIQQIIQGDSGNDGEMGPIGLTGATGAAGANGTIGRDGLSIIGIDGDQGEDGLPIPGPIGPQGPAGSAASAVWQLIATRTCTGNANEDFTGLSAYNELLVIVVAVTRSVSGVNVLRVSIDNGANYLSGATDYQQFGAAGSITNATSMQFNTTNSTLARNGVIYIKLFNVSTTPKVSETWSGNNYYVPNTSPLDAVRVLGSAGGTLDAGTIYVYGR